MRCPQCVREILCKLSDHRDVDNAGEIVVLNSRNKTTSFSHKVGPRQPWVTSCQRREFGGSWCRWGSEKCFKSIITHHTFSSQAHFTASQVQFILNKKPELKENKNCRRLYLELRKHFGIKQKYSELIMLCKNCRYLRSKTAATIRICLQLC